MVTSIKSVRSLNRMCLSQITSVITEPERKSMLQLARASPASRASYCYPAFFAENCNEAFRLANNRIGIANRVNVIHERAIAKDFDGDSISNVP